MDSTQTSNGTTTTVHFNVGGKLYEISKSLLRSFPDTLLAQKADTETATPIFIDRDPDRFAYCLDFMRDNGKVFLAEAVTKEALLAELKFFGFTTVDESLIQHDAPSKRQMSIRLRRILGEADKNIATRKNRLKMEEIALYCFRESLNHPLWHGIDVHFDGSKGSPFEGYPAYEFAHKDDFKKCLDKFGLVCTNTHNPKKSKKNFVTITMLKK